jgi:hypothetical protein
MLDPSYIRSIRDGIISGNIEANNQDALPDGLVGLYDKELFPPTLNWKERKETLHFFLVFALAQKEISADFAATILGNQWVNLHNDDESKEEKRLLKVSDLIQLHSKRFNSAGGGKYRLYHERFRLYILQKVSEQDIAQFNNKFITLCETALEITTEKDIPENESYALEFISTHFFISAMPDEKVCLNKEHAITLKKLAYNQQYWNRQVKASKGFEWSKRLLNEMMVWASKFNEDEEIIECAYYHMELRSKELSEIDSILEQVEQENEIDSVINRIFNYGDNSGDFITIRFVICFLCMLKLKKSPKKHSNLYLHSFKSFIEKNFAGSNIAIAFPQLHFEEIFDKEIGTILSKVKFVKGIETIDNIRTVMLERDGYNEDEGLYEVSNNGSKSNLYKLSLNVFQCGLSKYDKALTELKKISFFKNQITTSDKPYRLTCMYFLMTELLKNNKYKEIIDLLTKELKAYTKMTLIDNYEISSYLFGISDNILKTHRVEDLLIISNDVNLIPYHRTEVIRMISFLYLKHHSREKAVKYYNILIEDLKSVKGNARFICIKNSNILNKMLDGIIEIELNNFRSINSKFIKINKNMLIESAKLTFLVQTAIRNKFDTFTNILINFTLNQIFFSNLTQEKIDRYNRTLNMQWAIDIKNQLPN